MDNDTDERTILATTPMVNKNSFVALSKELIKEKELNRSIILTAAQLLEKVDAYEIRCTQLENDLVECLNYIKVIKKQWAENVKAENVKAEAEAATPTPVRWRLWR